MVAGGAAAIAPPRVRTWDGAAVPFVVGALTVIAFAGTLVAGRDRVHVNDVIWFGGWLTCALCGAVLARTPAGRRFGWLLLVAGAGAMSGLVAGVGGRALLDRGDDGGLALVVLARQLETPPMTILLGLGLLWFPTGRPPTTARIWRVAAAAAVAATVALIVADVLRPGRVDDDIARPNPLGVPVLRVALSVTAGVAGIVLLVLVGVGIAALVVRWRRGTAVDRMAVAIIGCAASWLVLTVATELFGELLGWRAGPSAILGPTMETLAILAIPIAALIAGLRRVAFDVEVVLNRNLTYLVLTVCVIAGYAGAVSVLSRLLDRVSPFGVSLLVTGLIAVAFGPLKLAVQQGVGVMLVGQRATPYRALATLGGRIDASLSPRDALAAAVATVAETFRVPFVALSVDVDGQAQVVARHGRPGPVRLAVPLTQRGRQLGTLELAGRSPNERFTAADERLLAGFATRIAGAVEAVQLSEQVQHSRAAVVRAAEEERRRIRRELHDGIGPVLASTALAVQRVERQLADDDPRRAALTETRSDVQQAIADIRRLVHGLRPAALDELGLAAAVRQRADALSADVTFAVDIAHLGELPAAVEVAVYRIVTEAMTNVVRHASATRASVVLAARDAGIVLTVADDGHGYPDDRAGGVGLTSMRERVAELGGDLTIESDDSGTRVQAWLPTA